MVRRMSVRMIVGVASAGFRETKLPIGTLPDLVGMRREASLSRLRSSDGKRTRMSISSSESSGRYVPSLMPFVTS